MSAELGCEYCRDAMRRFELPQVGVSEERHAFLYRCPVCRTYWIETERSTGPLSDDEVEREAPGAIAHG